MAGAVNRAKTDDALVMFAALSEERGPTVRELAAHLGVASTPAAYRIEALASEGLIELCALGNTRGWKVSYAGYKRIEKLRWQVSVPYYNITPLGRAALEQWRAQQAVS